MLYIISYIYQTTKETNFRHSRNASIFPEEFKVVKLKPVFKKDSKTDPKDYKPLSLLPLMSKFIKKTIHFQLENYLKENGLLRKYQSGFSFYVIIDLCLTQLMCFVLTDMDKEMHTGMISKDLQKALYTLDLEILLDMTMS